MTSKPRTVTYELNSLHRQNETQIKTLEVKVRIGPVKNEQKFILDTGASTTYVSREWGKKNYRHLPTTSGSRQTEITADGKTTHTKGTLEEVEVRINGVTKKVKMNILPMMAGMPLL